MHTARAGTAPLNDIINKGEQTNSPFQPSTQITRITVLKYLVSEAWWTKPPISSEMKQQAYSHLDLFVLLSLFL